MPAVTVGLHNTGIPAQLQLLLLQCLASAMNETQLTTTDIANPKQSITVTVDKDFFNNEANEKLIASVENNITKMIQQFQTAVVEEMKGSSSKSEHLLSETLRNFTYTSTRYQDMLENMNQENVKQSNTNRELEERLLNFSQEAINTQNAWVKENNKLYNTNQELQIMLRNMTNRNEELENNLISLSNQVSNLQKQIVKLTENHQQLQANVNLKDATIKDLEAKVKETTQKNQQLGNDLNKVTAKYTKIQQFLGITEQQQNYCKISPSSVLWKLAHKDPQLLTPAGAFIWTPTHSEVGAGKMHILYSSTRDIYVRGVGKEEIGGWDKGVYAQNSMLRMVENDYKVAYLARKVGTNEGRISWKFDLSDSGSSVDSIRILFSTALFHNGKVEVQTCSFSECLSIPIGNQVFETTNFQGVSQFIISAKTSLGLEGVAWQHGGAWQHGQLFRQLLSDLTGYGFEVTINMKRCDITVL